jgi:DNA-directed RNA polymerase sigma subunit (sigma70/sigma32)
MPIPAAQSSDPDHNRDLIHAQEFVPFEDVKSDEELESERKYFNDEFGYETEAIAVEPEIDPYLDELPLRERTVLVEYYGLAGNERSSLREIAAKHNSTRERVRAIKARALWRLRKRMKQERE